MQDSFADKNIKCRKCNEDLVMSKVNLIYLASEVNTDLPRCPKCGRVYISAELALGKMYEVERALEDK